VTVENPKANIPLLDRVPAPLLVLMAVLSIQLGSALAITLFPVFGPLGILFLRMALGGAVLCLLYRRLRVPALRRAPFAILLLGLILTVESAVFYAALARIPLGITVSIEFLGPLGLALVTSRRKVDVLCVLLAAAGILLLTPVIGTSFDPFGVLLAFCAGAGWACFILASARLSRKVESGVGLALAMAVAGLVLLPVAGIEALQGVAARPDTLPAIAGVALFSAAIPLLFEFVALRTMLPREYGVLVSIEPVVATVIGAVLLAETIGLRGWGAILLISLASAGVAYFRRLER
jgi:inner membrane transporter RhtA